MRIWFKMMKNNHLLREYDESRMNPMRQEHTRSSMRLRKCAMNLISENRSGWRRM